MQQGLHQRESTPCSTSGRHPASRWAGRRPAQPPHEQPLRRGCQLRISTVPALARRASQQHRWLRLRTADGAAGQLSAADLPPDSGRAYEEPIQVFPRLRERDPYRLLGLPPDANFEEVQDARNFLYETYKSHERSREAIEFAYEAILKQDMKRRQKYGFKPPKLGRRTDLDADVRKGFVEAFREKLEPSVPGTTIVNDGSIFLLLGIWSAWMSAAHDPTFPIGAAIAFCTWRLLDKRKRRNPDGPFLGNSPVWGALGSSMLGLFVGGVASWLLVQYVPLPGYIRPEAFGIFLINVFLGVLCIFFK